ncbi:hypothetical protein FQZ97_960080 [compost metagenome]
MILLQGFVTLFQEVCILFTEYKTHVWNGMDKLSRRIYQALFHQVGPVLLGELKLFKNLHGFGTIYRSVFLLGCIVQLT